MIYLKNKNEIQLLKKGGQILSKILDQIINKAKPGVNIKDLDILAEKLIRYFGGRPSFKNYKGYEDDPPFPSTMCISLNDEIVHGDGTRSIILQEGDIVDFDIGMQYPGNNGLYTDMSRTIPIGQISQKAEKLIKITKKSLYLGIKKAQPGNKIKDISKAIQNYVESQEFSVVRKLVGHGVGKEIHEDPMIPNFVDRKWGNIVLKEGMTLAIEPMVNFGGWGIKIKDDGWTVVTKDGSLSAHFEDTIVITKNGCEILTR